MEISLNVCFRLRYKTDIKDQSQTYPFAQKMAEGLTNTQTKRIAVVTGANKGIGLEICKQLASKGIIVVLTARDENRGKEALEKFREFGLSDFMVFHQLDVVDPTSVASFTDFVKTQFGKLDILVNNAGISGLIENASAPDGAPTIFNRKLTQNYESAVQCLETNYYGSKRMIEAFIPLLQLSSSPRIVNVSSEYGQLKTFSNEWAVGMLSDAEKLSEERVDEVVNICLKVLKEDPSRAKGWHTFPGYALSKVAMNAYTRILAKKYPAFCINCCNPGAAKTDMTYNTGYLSVEECAATPVKLALLPDGSRSGFFFMGPGGQIFDF